MPKRLTQPLIALLLILPTLISCDVPRPRATPTSITGAPISTAVSSGPVQTYVPPQPVPSGYVPIPPPVPSVGPTYTPAPIPTPDYSSNGDTPEAQQVLDKWRDAFLAVRSVCASQSFARILPDGSRQPIPINRYTRGDITTDEWYDSFGFRNGQWARFRVVIHSEWGDMTVLYDGRAAYKLWSDVSEVYQPWPDVDSPFHFWEDVNSVAAAHLLHPPPNAMYTLVGERELDGRTVIELVVKYGNSWPVGQQGTHVYLDKTTYLPYRVVTFGPSDKEIGYERTLTRLDVNTSVSDADFVPTLPPNAVTVYQSIRYGPYFPEPEYGSVREAKKDAGFVLFEPWENAKGKVDKVALVEIDGRRTPVLATGVYSNGVSIGSYRQGVYLPKADNRSPFGPYWGQHQSKVTTLEIDGHAAELHEYAPDHWQLRLTREGTQIEITARTKENAIDIAREMRQVP